MSHHVMTTVIRCLVLVMGGVYLGVMLRVQLNILAGYLYHQEDSAAQQPNNNIKFGKISQQIQEKFLSINNHFVQHGRWQRGFFCILMPTIIDMQVLRDCVPLSAMLLYL